MTFKITTFLATSKLFTLIAVFHMNNTSTVFTYVVVIKELSLLTYRYGETN